MNDIEYTRHLAKWCRIALAEALPDIGPGCQVDATVDYNLIMRRNLLLLEAYILAMPKKCLRIRKRWPADWWQAFKERWFPAWLKRFYPVRYRRIDIKRRLYGAVCPHLRNDKLSKHLEFLSTHDCKPVRRSGEADDSL